MTVYYYSKNQNGYITGRRFSIDEPATTVMAHGMGGDKHSSILLTEDGAEDRPPMTDAAKPPYRVPLMSEIAKIKWNGLTVVSTFAGAGGSSTGYRLAGYRVLLANEFVPIAQESYAANMGPHTVLAPEDVKALTGEIIFERTGLKRGELDVFDGSPPCQAFSTAGRREKGWGTDRVYDHGAAQKNEDLFDEYVRLVRELNPKVFVAENVSGLVKGTAKGYFLKILAALKGCGYVVTAKLLDAQWLGVPQARQRIIFVGVRQDLAARGFAPAFPEPLPYRYSVREALPWLGSARAVHDTSGQFSTGDITDRPSPRPTAHGPGHLKIIGRTDEIILAVGSNAGFGKTGMQSPDLPAKTIGTKYDSGNARSAPGMIEVRKVEPEADISRFAIGAEYDKLNPGQQSDKYFNLVRAAADVPSPTIMSSSGKFESAAAVMHPTEKRRFSIAELKCICAFPDDFILKGTYAQQWERLGNSVPPVMMMHVAAAIRDAVLIPARAKTSGPGRRSADRSTTGKPPTGAGKRPPRGDRGRPSGGAGTPPAARRPSRPRRPAEPAGGA